MGSSDEEEMRRVRKGRGFQTRMERAAAAAAAFDATIEGHGSEAATTCGTSADTGRGLVAVGILRREAPRAQTPSAEEGANDNHSNSSDEDEEEEEEKKEKRSNIASPHGAWRKLSATSTKAVEAATEKNSYRNRKKERYRSSIDEEGLADERVRSAREERLRDSQSSSSRSSSRSSSSSSTIGRGNMQREEGGASHCLATATSATEGEKIRKAEHYNEKFKRSMLSFHTPSESVSASRNAASVADSGSDDEDDLPGPRPLTVAGHSYVSDKPTQPFNQEPKQSPRFYTNDSDYDSRSVNNSIHCNRNTSDIRSNSSSSSSSSSSSKYKESVSPKDKGVEGRRKSTTSETEELHEYASEATTEAPGGGDDSDKTVVWHWKKALSRPAGLKRGDNRTSINQTESSDGSDEETKGEIDEDFDDDFLFEQVPELDGSNAEQSATTGTQPEERPSSIMQQKQQHRQQQQAGQPQLQQTQKHKDQPQQKEQQRQQQQQHSPPYHSQQHEKRKMERGVCVHSGVKVEGDGETTMATRLPLQAEPTASEQSDHSQKKDEHTKKQQQTGEKEHTVVESQQFAKHERKPYESIRRKRKDVSVVTVNNEEEKEEVEVEDDDDCEEKERRQLGLPLAFGCHGGSVATGCDPGDRHLYVKSFITRRADSKNDSSGATKRSSPQRSAREREGDSESYTSSDVAVTDEQEDEALRWKSLGLPVSLEVRVPAHSPAQVSAMAVNLKANRMATGGSDGFVRLWDFQGLHLENLRSYRSFCPAEKHKVEALAFSFRNDLLLVAAGDAVCRVYTAQAAELVHTTTRGDMYILDAANTKGHTHTVLDCQWHPLHANQFFSCGLDATIRLWDINAKLYGILQTLPHVTCFKTVSSMTCASGRTAAGNALRSSSADSCTCCVVAPTAADCLIGGCADGSLQLWGSLNSRRVFGRPDAIVRDAHAASPVAPASNAPPSGNNTTNTDTTSLATVSQRPAMGIVGGHGVYSSARTEAHKGHGVSNICFFSDDRRLVSRGEDGSVAMWDIRNFKRPTARAALAAGNISSSTSGGLCLSPDEKYVCVTTEGGASVVSEDTASAVGTVQVLRADLLSVVAALPIRAANVKGGSDTVPGAANSAAVEGGRTDTLPQAGAATQVKQELEKKTAGPSRDTDTVGSAPQTKCLVGQPLRVLWPQETNQLLVSCTDGSVCVLFDRQMSRKGILLCVDTAKGSRRRQAAELEAGIMYTQPYILVPGQLPEGFKETRDGQIIRVKPRGRERQRLFLEKQKTLIPPIPAKEGYSGANVGGGNRSQHLLRQLGLLDPPAAPGENDDDDPVAALRAYAKKIESSGRESQLISRAYAATQPHAVLEFDVDEEEAALVAGVASGAVEDSGRLLQQKTRCPRCALRMCQCGYIDEQNVAASAPGSKRQRV